MYAWWVQRCHGSSIQNCVTNVTCVTSMTVTMTGWPDQWSMTPPHDLCYSELYDSYDNVNNDNGNDDNIRSALFLELFWSTGIMWFSFRVVLVNHASMYSFGAPFLCPLPPCHDLYNWIMRFNIRVCWYGIVPFMYYRNVSFPFMYCMG
jgi:hypothetical protein